MHIANTHMNMHTQTVRKKDVFEQSHARIGLRVRSLFGRGRALCRILVEFVFDHRTTP